MKSRRSHLLRLIVGLGLLVILILPIQLLIGNLASSLPTGLAVGIGFIAWFGGTVVGTHFIVKQLGEAFGLLNVLENPDCQPRRNRLPGYHHRPANGDHDRRGLFRCRCARAACGDG